MIISMRSQSTGLLMLPFQKYAFGFCVVSKSDWLSPLDLLDCIGIIFEREKGTRLDKWP